MAITKKLASTVWNTRDYYRQAGVASEVSHPSLVYLKDRYKGKKIFEVGCGEGTKLGNLSARYKAGLDISSVAIKLASQKLDQAVVGDAENLPFKDKSFDAVLSFFSLEHFEHPENVLSEMIRVVKEGGEVVVLTPNFGAPNRCSPCYVGSRVKKLILGFVHDFLPRSTHDLGWNHVTPLTDNYAYQIDYDTLVEPYALTLVRYFKQKGLQIIKVDTNWDIPVEHENLLQKIFKILGKLGVYPFKYWGPHCFVVACA